MSFLFFLKGPAFGVLVCLYLIIKSHCIIIIAFFYLFSVLLYFRISCLSIDVDRYQFMLLLVFSRE
jgi:hypothetical protein